jgi:hypothetical protein
MDLDDLSQFDALVSAQEKGRECTIRHPVSKAPLSLVITVCGRGSKRYKQASRWLTARFIETGVEGVAETDDADVNGIEFLARLCVGWEGCQVDGETLPFSIEAATALFTRFPFIFEQVDAFASSPANFSGA